MKSMPTALVAGLGLCFVACELKTEDQAAIGEVFAAEGIPAPEAPPFGPVPPACFASRFTQPEADIDRFIDILFVTDTSGSIHEERAKIAKGIDSFVSALPENVDYNVAVLLAHGSKSSRVGKLHQSSGSGAEPVVLKSSERSLAQIRDGLTKKFTNPPTDNYSDGGEEGLYSFLKLTEGAKLANAKSAGFFRENAALAVVFVSDENDICAIYPDGVTPVRDPEKQEAAAKVRDCAGVTPQVVRDRIVSLQAGRPFLIGGIVYTDSATMPREGENELGYGYLETIQAGGGIAVDMASGSYNQGLASIGRLATIRMTLLTDFQLGHTNADPASIDVRVDGGAVPYTFTAEQRLLRVLAPGTARSTVDIRYCLKAEESGGGTNPGGGSGGEEGCNGNYCGETNPI